MISLYLLIIASATECDPNLPIVMEDTKNGITTEFFVSENKHGQCLPNGKWTETWDNGNVRLYARFKHGKECGTWTYFYRDGKIKSEGNYCCGPKSIKCKFGEQYGLWTSWYNSGHIEQIGYYCKDGQCGRWYQLWSNGNLRSDTTWQSGKLSGEAWNYFPNGKVASHGWIDTDKKVGKWVWYDNKGNITVEKDFGSKTGN